MAGDWIKMRSDLFTHPKVVRMSSALKADTLRTVGGLMSVWCLFDAHSEDGKLIGYTAEILDDHLRWPGFAFAMQAISWLSDDGESLVLPEFETHNGQSAKRRAQDADRKREVRKTSASDADKKRTREEKRREENKEEDSSSGDDPKVPSLEARLSEVTLDAVETWNESALVAGGLAKVRTSVGMDKRRQQVRRMLSVAREICRERFGETRIPRKFWVGLWDQYAGDDFFSGRTTGGKGHENWRPDFKYLTHPETVVKLYDKVCAGEATA